VRIVSIPLLKVRAAAHGETGDYALTLRDSEIESMIAAPADWCPNPADTLCLQVRGKSMMPLISEGSILAVDLSQNERTRLSGKIVIAQHPDQGLTVTRLHRYNDTEVLQPENRAYESIILSSTKGWNILARVLWWISKAP
jgi:SOS-response transcriptional repressor LexA